MKPKIFLACGGLFLISHGFLPSYWDSESAGEEDGGILGGAGEVGWEERCGDGGIEGGVGWMEVVGGDDEVDLLAGGGGGVEAFGGGALDLEPSLDG